MKKFFSNTVVQKIIVNFLLWFLFTAINFFIYVDINSPSPFANVPSEMLYKLIDYKSALYLLGSALFLYAVFSFFSDEAKNEDEKVNNGNLKKSSRLEFSSVLFNLGSLTLAVAYFSSNFLLLFAGLFCYFLGYHVHPKV
jgi:hypothetical protein